MSVNFYKRFPGDYMRDTAHLSLAEHGVYSVLLDAYYATESPLPLHREAVYRMARATTTNDRLAVDSVLKQFWKEQPDGWHNTRANEEIRKYNNQREANTQVAHDREAKKRKVKAALPQTKPNNAFLNLDAFKAAYPKRAGSQPWLKAAAAATARMKEGCTFDSMVSGARRYAAFCEASEQLNTKFVMQASTFLGPERHFLEAWDPPTEEVDVLGEAMAANEEAIRRERAGAQGVRQPDHVGDEAWQAATIEATGVEVETRLLLEDAE